MSKSIVIEDTFNQIHEAIMDDIEDDGEYLQTLVGDEVHCISVENMKGILDRRLAELEQLIQDQNK